MCFDTTTSNTRLCRPDKQGGVITAGDEPTSIGTEHHYCDDRFMCNFAIAFLILELLGHGNDKSSSVKGIHVYVQVEQLSLTQS